MVYGLSTIKNMLHDDKTFEDISYAGQTVTGAEYNGCTFKKCDFSNSNANFITAYNYDIDPEINLVKKASFSAQGIHGLLSKYQLKIV
jgi:fluoroquinolone resistance protein